MECILKRLSLGVLQNTLRTTSSAWLITITVLVSVLTASGFNCTFNNQLPHRFQTESPRITRFNFSHAVSYKRFVDQHTQSINIRAVCVSLAVRCYDLIINSNLADAPIPEHRFLNPIFFTSHKARSSSEPFIS